MICKRNFIVYSLGLWCVCVFLTSHDCAIAAQDLNAANSTAIPHQDTVPKRHILKTIAIGRTVKVGEYFGYIDSLVQKYDSTTPYKLTEHLLVRANPWIMDTLANTDYYRMIARDSFVYDQSQLYVLRPGNTLVIPDSLMAHSYLRKMEKTRIDINIPEFRLRIFQDTQLIKTFPVRVGRNAKRYLEMSGKVTDLRTIHGSGQIVRHARSPDFINPVDCRRFYLTRRDDGKTTFMPVIPWIETEINGIRNGQMIHPTTNPETLGKAYSNGCIGTREADAWYIYYYAPIGTKITIRYDLEVTDEKGNPVFLKDIYGYH